MALLFRAVAATAAAKWVAVAQSCFGYDVLDFAALGVAYQIAGKFLDTQVTTLDASR